MHLIVDIGNTNVVIGIFEQGEWVYIWRLSTNKEIIASEYEIRIRQFFLESTIKISNITDVAISSVVPELTAKIKEVCDKLFVFDSFLITPDVIIKLDLGEVVRPNEIGSDLVANSVGANELFSKAAIIIDFGTALTFTSVSSNGYINGVAISPGVKTAMKSLSANTAKLPEIPLEIPQTAIGKNTVHALQSGIMQGYVGLVKHMVNQISIEMNDKPVVLATGGLSFIFKPLHDTIDEILPNLTLFGIKTIYERSKSFSNK
jgi:type III pantothenate kinase